jgi:hypothetical protein
MPKKKLLIADDDKLLHQMYADEYVAKPVSLAYLKRTIGKLLP